MAGATRAARRVATRRHTSVGMITSVESGLCGPCCSVEPVGTSTRSFPPSRYSSTCVSVSSAMKTDGRGISGRRRALEPGVVEAGDAVVALDPLEPRDLLLAAL